MRRFKRSDHNLNFLGRIFFFSFSVVLLFLYKNVCLKNANLFTTITESHPPLMSGNYQPEVQSAVVGGVLFSVLQDGGWAGVIFCNILPTKKYL